MLVSRLEACFAFDDGVQVLAEVKASRQRHILTIDVEPCSVIHAVA